MKHIVLGMLAAAAAMAYSGPGPVLSVLPASAELTTPESHQHFLAEVTVEGYQQDWTKKAEWSSSNPQVAQVDAQGFVKPVGDGDAVITAKANGLSATATVKVRGSHAPFVWSFRNQVVPVLSKVGCNQGACHGALAGKNGFKLTLRGYAPEVDYDTLTREAHARRVSLADPAASLMLLKPSFSIPHGGGKRFSKDSLQYRIIYEWIAAGAPAPKPDDPEVTGLEVFPRAATLKAGDTQQLVVRAKYSDGHVEPTKNPSSPRVRPVRPRSASAARCGSVPSEIHASSSSGLAASMPSTTSRAGVPVIAGGWCHA